MTERRLRRPLLLAAALPLLLLGCEGSDSGEGGAGTWNEPVRPTTTTRPAAPKATTTTRPAAVPTTSAPPPQPSAPATTAPPESAGGDASADGAVGADQVSFGSLKWTFGGKPNGAGARNGGVVIAGARFSQNGVSFSYVKDLSAWGYSNSALGGIACLFVQKENGSWVGGKFDWISSSRRSRDFLNVYSGYAGWSLDGVPSPCQAAFVIVSPDGKRRSNVIIGSWSHR